MKITAVVLLTLSVAAAQSRGDGSWLERPLTARNKAGESIPAPVTAGDKVATTKRCNFTPPRSTAAEKAVEAAGWIPFWNVDQQLIRDEVEIVGGMASADANCAPAHYNLFVFVAGQFAGVLSPAAMTTASDGASGAVRLSSSIISAEFARYTNTDTPCCPSSRVTVRYRIDRTPAGPVVVPTDIRTTRP